MGQHSFERNFFFSLESILLFLIAFTLLSYFMRPKCFSECSFERKSKQYRTMKKKTEQSWQVRCELINYARNNKFVQIFYSLNYSNGNFWTVARQKKEKYFLIMQRMTQLWRNAEVTNLKPPFSQHRTLLNFFSFKWRWSDKISDYSFDFHSSKPTAVERHRVHSDQIRVGKSERKSWKRFSLSSEESRKMEIENHRTIRVKNRRKKYEEIFLIVQWGWKYFGFSCEL